MAQTPQGDGTPSSNTDVYSQSPGFVVELRETTHATVVVAQGAIDLLTGPLLTQAIEEALVDGLPALVIDLTEVDFLSSAGMSALLQAREDAAASSIRLAVVADGPTTSRPLKLLGLDRVLDLYPTLDAALIEEHNQRLSDAVAEIAEARSAIDMTKGMLMVIYGLQETDAFERLRTQSRRTNTNLRALARQFRDDVADMTYENEIPSQEAFDELFRTAHTRLRTAGT